MRFSKVFVTCKPQFLLGLELFTRILCNTNFADSYFMKLKLKLYFLYILKPSRANFLDPKVSKHRLLRGSKHIDNTRFFIVHCSFQMLSFLMKIWITVDKSFIDLNQEKPSEIPRAFLLTGVTTA